MLNPSTADAERDDATIRRCRGFAQRWGYFGITVGNLFAWRATSPRELKRCADPVGQENDKTLQRIFHEEGVVICAWGNSSPCPGRASAVLNMIVEAGKVPYCLKLTMKGNPAHPLYVPGEIKPLVFRTWTLRRPQILA